MQVSGDELVGIICGASFAAGLNVYATVAALGLLGRFDVIALPSSLNVLENPVTIGVALFMFLVEFVADKIPGFDLLWNALQTFVRVPVAALLAFLATRHMAPWEQAGATVIGGLIALAAHSGKLAARAVITPSPEPVTNMTLSLAEDGVAVFFTWLATHHPYVTAVSVAVLLALVILAIRAVIGALKRLFRGANRQLRRQLA